MVATLLALRLRVLLNGMKRSALQLVLSILGALYALFLVGGATAGLVALGLFAEASLATTVVVLGGSALVAGWTLVPLLLSGIDQTLEPARLAQYPIPRRTLLIALTFAGLIGIPGIATALVGLASALVWLRDPLALVVAIPSAIVGVFIAIVASRTVTAAVAGLSSSRRARELSGILVFVPLILLGPIVVVVFQGLADSANALPVVAQGLGWTPLGAAWAVPAAVAVGDPGGAALRFLIAVASLGLLFVGWRAALGGALVSVTSAGGRSVSRGRLGAFAIVPQTPAGAVAARCLTYWRRDPRYARQLIAVPLVPVLLWFYSSFTGSSDLVMWSGPFVAFSLALTLASDISFDGTAFATHLIDGVRGRDDRLGRVGALATFALPVTVLFAVGGVAVVGQWQHLPSILGLSLGMLLAGLGVVSVSSARYVIPVPQAGDNPFKAAPGAGFTTGLQVFVVMGITFLVVLPTGILAVVGFVTGAAVWGWAALACGVVIGAVAVTLGIRFGGALLDRTGPRLLLQLRRQRGA